MAVCRIIGRFIRPGYTPMDPPKRIKKRLGKIYKILKIINK